ncbi:calcyphosin-like protein isoform X2 [Tubulanus polymorphus]|uniref:calcyphosin-like protein isoform X2 n=1 Tax=Tubulanus polymorphus TaxID=672921 RepID=UPI003DA1D3B3
MAATERGNRELMQKSAEEAKNAKTPIEKLRCQCLSRGAHGIKGLGRSFRIMDDDRSRSLDFNEFKKGIENYGLQLETNEIREMFEELDRDNSGSLDFEEFLKAVRPPMSRRRVKLIHEAFVKLDRTGDGVVTVEDLHGVYDVSKHPKYLNGELTKDQCLRKFLDSFDSPDDKDGQITKEEFTNYYAGVSASIDQDAYFDLMMRTAWKI